MLTTKENEDLRGMRENGKENEGFHFCLTLKCHFSFNCSSPVVSLFSGSSRVLLGFFCIVESKMLEMEFTSSLLGIVPGTELESCVLAARLLHLPLALSSLPGRR